MASEQAPAASEAPVDSDQARRSGDVQSSAFQAAIGAWRSIDLTSLQKSLDATASEIVNGQRDGLVERKELASKTKEYRRLDEEAKKEEWKGLLKSYQTFIDHLTASKKEAETAFLSLYSTLSEAPDPYPLLEASIDSLVNFSEVQATTKENGSLKATIARLNSQVSNLESSLAAKNKELEKKNQEIAEEAKRVEEVWKGVLDERSRNWESKEKALNDKIEDQEGVLKEMKASYEVAQRMGHTAASEDFLGKEQTAELEIMTRDLERTTLRLAEVEGRNEQLRLQLEKASTDAPSPNPGATSKSAEDDEHILRLQNENASLLRRIDSAKSDLESARRQHERKVRTLERTIAGLESTKDELRDKVAKWSDYDDIRRELEILKSIEFSTGDDDEDILTSSNPVPASPTATSKKESLEQLLLARNKKLGNELTVLRVSHQDLTTRLATLQQTLDSTTSELASARQLNEKLEDDLLKLQTSHSHPNLPAMSVAGTYVSRYPSTISRARVSPTSSIISGIVPADRTPITPHSDDRSIVPMLTAQRDRFRQRNTELESELAQANSTISSLRSEVASLQKDNLALYEKTRYIHTYTPARATSASAATERYRKAYEANMSPFEAFRGRESARAYKRLKWWERIIYAVTRVVLANRWSRNLFALYCLALHALVLWVIFEAGGSAAKVATTAAEPGQQWKKTDFDGRL